MKTLPLATFFFLLLSLSFLTMVASLEEEHEHEHEHEHEDDHDHKPTASSQISCAKKLTMDKSLLPFDTSSLKCYTAWSTQDFILMYEESGGNIWNFLLSAPNKDAYIAIGFSPNGMMVGSSSVVGWMKATGKGMARQYYLGAMNPKSCVVDKGDLNLVKGKTLIFSDASRLWLAFQLNSTGPPKDKLIYAIGPKGVIPDSDMVLADHADMASTTVNYETGEVEEEEEDGLKTTHGLLAMIGWGALVPIGVLVARYAKGWDPLWFYSHIVIQFVGAGLGIAAIVTGFKLEDDGHEGDDVDKHKIIGITILVIGALQIMALLLRPNKESKLRKYWNWYHHNFGRAAIALAIANIFYGLYIAHEEKKWRIGYGVFLGVWGLIALVLEIRMWTKKK